MRCGSTRVIQRSDLIGRGDCDAADHGAFDAGIEQLADALERAQAAADLQAARRVCRARSQNDLAIRLRAVACAVEIDDVHAARAERAIALEHALRIVRSRRSPLRSRP